MEGELLDGVLSFLRSKKHNDLEHSPIEKIEKAPSEGIVNYLTKWSIFLANKPHI